MTGNTETAPSKTFTTTGLLVPGNRLPGYQGTLPVGPAYGQKMQPRPTRMTTNAARALPGTSQVYQVYI